MEKKENYYYIAKFYSPTYDETNIIGGYLHNPKNILPELTEIQNDGRIRDFGVLIRFEICQGYENFINQKNKY